MNMSGAFGRWSARLTRDLTGHSSGQLVSLLREQFRITGCGAHLVEQLTAAAVKVSDAHDQMRQLEHEGDGARGRLIVQMRGTLVTPIDAEDIFRVSRSLDDVLDNLRDFVREVDLYQPARIDFAHPLAQMLVKGIERLEPALDQLGSVDTDGKRSTLATRKAVGQGRRLYQQQLAQLFAEPIDSETLKQRELLRRLDIVGLRLGETSDALADGLLKRCR